jgi:hypothetical protein
MIKIMWRGRNKSQRLAVMRVFLKLKPQMACNATHDLARVSDPQLRAAAAELLGVFPDEGGKGLGAVLPLLADKEPLVRLAAAASAARIGNPEANTRMLALLEDKDWRVAAAAMKAVTVFRQKASIQPLIDYMRNHTGRLVDDAKKALTAITGFDYPADPDRWQKWWDRTKDGFKVPTAEELKRRKESRKSSGYATPKTHHPPYHGIKTRSRRMLFVVDISTSMINNVVLDDSKPRVVKEFHENYGDSRSKIEITRNELIKIVAGLKPFVRFNIITFNSEVQYWSKGLVSANTGNRYKAIKFLDKLTPTNLEVAGRGLKSSTGNAGQTNSCAALRACYEVTRADDQLKKRYKTQADTVFFLSDGNPTIGDIVEPQPLLEHLMELNRKAGLVIHTIGFGSGNSAIMRTIAEITGGQYVCIGE